MTEQAAEYQTSEYTEFQDVVQSTDQSPEIGELAGALAKAQGEMTGAKKASDNPFFKSKYADLGEVWDACRGPLSTHNLAVIQTTASDNQSVTIITTLAHSSGQWVRGRITMYPTKCDAQGFGSAITYGRRYGLSAITGVAQVDDDGEAAMGRSGGKVSPSKTSPKFVKEFVSQTLSCLENGDEHGLNELWSELNTDEKAVMWGKFNSQQRSTMKQLMGGGA